MRQQRVFKKLLLISFISFILFFPFLVFAQEYHLTLPENRTLDFRFNESNNQWQTRLSTGRAYEWLNVSQLSAPAYSGYLRYMSDDQRNVLNQMAGFSGNKEAGERLINAFSDGFQGITSQQVGSPQTAASAGSDEIDPNTLKPQIVIDIGGFNKGSFSSVGPTTCPGGEGTCLEISWLSQYIGAIYKYGVGLAAILAVVMMMVGGLLWLMSGGSPNSISKAKDFITSAFTGLLLALFSFMLLYIVNPKLIDLAPLKVKKIEAVPLELQEGGVAPIVASANNGNFGGYIDSATNPTLAGMPGSQRLTGTNQQLIDVADSIVTNLGANGQLPEGFTITSGLRSNDTGSQHALGRAFDVSWPGINEASADAFIAQVRNSYPNLNIIREITPAEQAANGATGPNIHLDIRRYF